MQPTTSVPLLLALGPSQVRPNQQQAIQSEQRQQQKEESASSRPKLKHKQQQRKLTKPNKARTIQQQSNRLLAQARGSKLVENFSEYLASRNVINRYSSRYDKIVSAPRTTTTTTTATSASSSSSSSSLASSTSSSSSASSRLRDDEELLFSQPTQGQQQRQRHHHHHPDFRCDKLKQSCSAGARQPGTGDAIGHKPSRVILLIGALLSRHHRNKASVLATLLRAPIVLAALFSLVLVATLLTLYTMSFHHSLLIYPAQHPDADHLLALGLTGTAAGSHSINSRHLQATVIVEAEAESGDETEAAAGDQQPPVDDAFDRALTVQTECGAFVGAPQDSAIAFTGIAYASPPVGARRWTRPRPIWLDERLCRRNRTSLANERRSHCAQLSPVTRRFSGHEDCLYLDIYAPKLDQVQKLPVMVYIHGGFLAFGSSGQGRVNWLKARPGGQLASELNVVLVAFNYRLQALGFMTLSQLAQNNGPDGSEGNYGLWDQLMALNWIKRNIESFGGDPDNIVLFGPDSASALPLALMTGTAAGGPRRAAAPAGEPDLEASSRGAAESIQARPTTNNNNHHQRAGGRHRRRRPHRRLPSRDLFRAAWLTNPTVYYERPYEVANRHYQRLFLDQSPCQTVAAAAAAAASGANLMLDNNNKPLPPIDNSSAGGYSGQESASDRIQSRRPAGQLMLQCLMNLSAEQVVRYYLRQDDPSYRLDDQNSLPIHGVLVDQFVTMDRELVQDSYPFAPPPSVRGRRAKQAIAASTIDPSGANLNQPQVTSSRELLESANKTSANNNHYLPPNIVGPKANESSTATATTTAAVETATTTTDAHSAASGASNDDYDDDDQDGQDERDDNCVGAICALGGKDLLLGSSAQAVEYWPCPRDLNQWQWDDFRRYVNISLNSFIADTYRRASALYGVPSMGGSNPSGGGGGLQVGADRAFGRRRRDDASRGISDTNDNNSSSPSSPIKTYLTMVSDIRQTCPINELANSLSSRGHRVHRYIVETSPSGNRLSAGHANGDRDRPSLVGSGGGGRMKHNTPQIGETTASQMVSAQEAAAAPHRKLPNYAFHTWDLMAFFGFEFEPSYEPSAADLKFQSHIREMVRRFVHREGHNDETPTPADIKPVGGGGAADSFGGYTLFGQGASKVWTHDMQHKSEECRMWRQHLGQAYAWVS